MNDWDKFITSQPDYTFLQSWNWGEFQKAMGEKVWRLENSCQAFTVTAKRGKFLFVPHLTTKIQDTKYKIQEIAKKENCSFIRVSPWLEDSEENRNYFKKLGFRPAPIMMHAEETWLVPLDKSEEEIFSGMRKTHRNLIRRATKENVIIEKSTNLSDLSYLSDLQLEAAKRHNFVPFSKEYLEKEITAFGKDAVLFLGKHRDEILSAALIIFYGKFAFYYQSGSKTSNIPVNYLLQWEVIKEAKKRGCTIYNLWGVTAENKSNASGLLTFKSGFGGYQKNYLHAQDLILSPKYYLTYVLERIPRKWRALF